MRDIWISAVAVRLASELECTVDGIDAVILGSVGPVPGEPARSLPGKEALFAAYVRAQEEACASLENRVVCVTWVLKNPDQERSVHEAR
jgi:hypothetical protein